ncbi:MAG: hypothetical protein F4163_13210 [Acidimicrobiaceae bacterium]|nr:hypothetical protein [Acidimicrobiaceae bacterium]
MTVGDHGVPELVKDQQLLGKGVFTDDPGQPIDNLVDLRSVDGADLLEMALPRFEPPLRVQGETHMGEPQELLIDLCLGEVVGQSRLKIQDHVDVVGCRDLDPGPDHIQSGLIRKVPVVARAACGDGGNDLESGQHGVTVGVVALGDRTETFDAPVESLFSEHSEARCLGVAVHGHHAAGLVRIEQNEAASRQLSAAAEHFQLPGHIVAEV